MLLIPRRLVINTFNTVLISRVLHFLCLWHYFAAAPLMHPGFSATQDVFRRVQTGSDGFRRVPALTHR